MSKVQIQKSIENNELDLSLQSLTDVDFKEILKFPKVRSIDLSCNVIENLSANVGLLIKVTKLDLSKNRIQTIPEEIGQMVNLEYLDLRDNKLTNLPLGMCNLKKLKWLDLKGNPLKENLRSAAGDCLNSSKCEACAVNVLACLELMKDKKEKTNQKKKLKENEILKQKEKIEKEVRERKKLEKTQERQMKRKLEQENLAKASPNVVGKESNIDNTSRSQKVSKKNQSKHLSGLLSYLFVAIVLSVLLTTILIMTLLACSHRVSSYNDHTIKWCRTVNENSPSSFIAFRDHVRGYIGRFAFEV